MGPLSDSENIRLISTNFVPVAVNIYTINKAKDAAADFFRSVRKQRRNYQGFWIVTPEGKVLSAHQDYQSAKTWVAEARAAIRAGITAFGPIPPRQPKWRDPYPFRGRGVQPDGRVTLAVYIRHTAGGRPQGEAALDSIHLTAKQWEGLAPPEPAAGMGWSVPDDVARQLAKCLSPLSDQSVMPRPNEVREVELIGNVRFVEGGIASLTFSGEIAAVHKHPSRKDKTNRASARIRGVGTYDLKGKQLLTVGLVLEGVFYNYAPYDREPQPFLAGVEWRR